MSVTPGATTGLTIGTAAFPTLSAQPLGYEETNTRSGLTARKWLVTGPLKASEWLALINVYDTWRNTRINDEPTEVSGVVGTTISLSGKGPGNQTWTNIACWFISAPQAEQNGRYLSASIELVDASQALAVVLRQIEEEEEVSEEDLPDLGTITLGTTVLTLTKPVETYAAGPGVELTATGVNYITGPLVVQRIRDVEGTTNSEGWTAIRSWYESQIVLVPGANTYFPISPPSATAENKIINGVKTVQYTVSVQLQRVI